MDEGAIKRIEALARAGEIAGLPDGSIPYTALPDGMSLHSLEQALPAPVRHRGRFETHLPQSFADYCNAQPTDECVLFLTSSREALLCKAIFDFGSADNPAWQQHTAVLVPQATVEYDTIIRHDQQSMSQREFCEFLEDWGDYMTLRTEGDDVDTATGIALLRRLTVEQAKRLEHRVGDLNAGRTSIEEIEISGVSQLPTGIVFDCISHHGLPAYVFEARIRYAVADDGDELRLSYSIRAIDRLRQVIAERFLDELVRLVDNTATFYMGEWRR